MRILQSWLKECDSRLAILDLGCGKGSFNFRTECAVGAFVVGVDSEFKVLLSAGSIVPVCSEGTPLPFKPVSFDLVICHHSLEHFRDAQSVVREIARVLKPSGRIFVSVPDGYSFSDYLYRILLTGGGHHQQFTFESLVRLVQSETGLRLVAWKRLYSSFNYVDKRNFIPAPLGALPGPLPRRMRWIGKLPSGLIKAICVFLNIATRSIDRYSGMRLSQYGWAFAFDVSPQVGAIEEATPRNVCMKCGYGAVPGTERLFFWNFLYRCENCNGVNVLFEDVPED